MNDYRINTTDKTSTGNQCAYFLAGHHGINAPVWEFEIGPESLADLQHAEALEINRTEFPNLHVHWESESSDCDGRHGDYGIIRPRADEYDETGAVKEYDFWSGQVENLVFAYAATGTLKVTDRGNGDLFAEWSESTDEGYRYRSARLCSDECETPRNTVYDQYAQEAGY